MSNDWSKRCCTISDGLFHEQTKVSNIDETWLKLETRYPVIGEWSWSSIFINPITIIYPLCLDSQWDDPSQSVQKPARMVYLVVTPSEWNLGPGKKSPTPIILIVSNCFKGTVPKKVLYLYLSIIYSLIPVKVNQGVSTGGSRILNTANLVIVPGSPICE